MRFGERAKGRRGRERQVRKSRAEELSGQGRYWIFLTQKTDIWGVRLMLFRITKKRQDMRYNLQEGNSQPPNVIAPHFGSVTTFDTTTWSIHLSTTTFTIHPSQPRLQYQWISLILHYFNRLPYAIFINSTFRLIRCLPLFIVAQSKSIQ